MKYSFNISHSRYLIFLGLVLASCGADYSGTKRAPASVGGLLTSERSLTALEKSRALSICYAFKSKKSTFAATQIGSVFSFQVDEKKCDNSTFSAQVDTTLRQVLQSSPMIFDTDETKFIFREVQTSDYGVMMPMCESLFLGDEAGNTYESAAGEKIALSFTSVGAGDWLVVSYARAILDNNGEKTYEVYQKDSHRIELNASAPSPTYGMILETERVRACENSTRTYQYTQKLIKP